MPIIIKVSRHASKSRPKVVSAPRSVKVVKQRFVISTKVGESTGGLHPPVVVELPSENKPDPPTFRQIRRPRNAVAALLAWNSLFQTGVA